MTTVPMHSARKCYAASFNQCSGKLLSREHFISANLLRKLGNSFTVDGLPWASEPKTLTTASFQARVCCEKHNEALSPLDTVVGRLYDILDEFARGGEVGFQRFDGELLERWALKVLIGMGVSGNLPGLSRDRIDVVPELWLRLLFGHESMPEGCGFWFLRDHIEGMADAQLAVAPLRYGAGDREEGLIYGVAVSLLGFRFAVSATLVSPRFSDTRAIYRPLGYALEDRGYLALRWVRKPRVSELIYLTSIVPNPLLRSVDAPSGTSNVQ